MDLHYHILSRHFEHLKVRNCATATNYDILYISLFIIVFLFFIFVALHCCYWHFPVSKCGVQVHIRNIITTCSLWIQWTLFTYIDLNTNLVLLASNFAQNQAKCFLCLWFCCFFQFGTSCNYANWPPLSCICCAIKHSYELRFMRLSNKSESHCMREFWLNA